MRVTFSRQTDDCVVGFGHFCVLPHANARVDSRPTAIHGRRHTLYSGLPSKIGSIVTGLVTKPSRIRLRMLPAGEHSTGWGLFEGRPFGSLNDSLSGVGLVIGTCVSVRHRVHSACVNAASVVFFARECCWNDG